MPRCYSRLVSAELCSKHSVINVSYWILFLLLQTRSGVMRHRTLLEASSWATISLLVNLESLPSTSNTTRTLQPSPFRIRFYECLTVDQASEESMLRCLLEDVSACQDLSAFTKDSHLRGRIASVQLATSALSRYCRNVPSSTDEMYWASSSYSTKSSLFASLGTLGRTLRLAIADLHQSHWWQLICTSLSVSLPDGCQFA